MKPAVVVVLAVLALSAVSAMSLERQHKLKLKQARAAANAKFDWNHGTAAEGALANSNIWEAPRTLWSGVTRNTYPGGHNFATRRAVDYMIGVANLVPADKEAVEDVYQTSLTALNEDKDKTSEFVKELVKGNFMNEVRVNIDGEGSQAVSKVAAVLRQTWLPDRDLSPATGTIMQTAHSEWWTPDTGYSSANPIHAMLQESKTAKPGYTQVNSYDQMVTFVHEMIGTAIKELRRAKGQGHTANWLRGVHMIGSVLHTVQDSACTCTERHWTAGAVSTGSMFGSLWQGTLQLAHDCIPGDGHSVTSLINGRWLATGMSNTEFYDARHDYHAQLDKMYEPGRVMDIAKVVAANGNRAKLNQEYNADAALLWGDNDPAYDGGNLLLAVARAVRSDELPFVSAVAITREWLEARYVPKSQLRMPTIDEAKKMKTLAQAKYKGPKVKTD